MELSTQVTLRLRPLPQDPRQRACGRKPLVLQLSEQRPRNPSQHRQECDNSDEYHYNNFSFSSMHLPSAIGVNFLSELRKERERLGRELQQVESAIDALSSLDGRNKTGRGRRSASVGRRGRRQRISAAGRARIAAAQRARWAKARRGLRMAGVGVMEPTIPAAAAIAGSKTQTMNKITDGRPYGLSWSINVHDERGYRPDLSMRGCGDQAWP
jgi:hypothetical protein